MFYTFIQNNSGGHFHLHGDLAVCVVVEADTAEQANERAKSIGIYFDGVEAGRDCECCGSRWYRASEGCADETPDAWGHEGKVIYLDGRVVEMGELVVEPLPYEEYESLDPRFN